MRLLISPSNLGKGEVTVGVAGVLTKGSTLLTNSIKNVQKSLI